MSMIKLATQFIDIIKNRVGSEKLIYITESADWVIKWIDHELAYQFRKNGLISATTRVSDKGARNKILHYGSINTIVKGDSITIWEWQKIKL